MQQVANLLAFAAKARVLQWQSEVVIGDPQSKHALIDLAELTGTRNHAAAVYHRARSVGRDVFLDDELRRGLGRAVDRASSIYGKPFVDPVNADTGDLLTPVDIEPCRSFPQTDCAKRRDR